ncbi:glycosyltransferase family 4 protein [Listeria floridensis]|uniref:glycosyltransferase family 4 protein n=1 Tax=Listeria floridensis TaxID=1494962 RepID=UPI00068D51FA|nr:glycosyltransferase family 4 protein [Listeria floridensis]
MFGASDLFYLHYASHAAWAVLLAKKLRPSRKLVVNLHGSDVFPTTKIQRKLQNKVSEIVCKADQIVVPSSFFKNTVAQKYHVDKNKIWVSPSGGVDTSVFYPTPKGYATTITFGYVGRIDPGKGWDVALRAFAELCWNQSETNLKLVMIGSGQEELAKEKLIDKLDLRDRVESYSALPQEQLASWYQDFDVFLFPTELNESLGLVGIESMACGTPVIGSDIPSIRGYLKPHHNGLLFSKGDKTSLFQAMNQFLSLSPAERKQLGENAITTAQNYSTHIVKNQLLRLVRQLEA